MAVYRHIHIDYWQDGFVLDLTPEEKYFYIYLMTNSKTSQCGIYELPKRIIETETGYNRETIEKLLKRFEDYGKIIYSEESKEIFIKNWLKHNKVVSPKVKKCVEKELLDIKSIDLINLFLKECHRYGYAIDIKNKNITTMDSVSIPITKVENNFEYGYGEKEKQKEKEEEKEKYRDGEINRGGMMESIKMSLKNLNVPQNMKKRMEYFIKSQVKNNLESSEKNLKEYRCYKCRDMTFIINDDVAVPCSCRKVREAEDILKKSGISKKFRNKRFDNFDYSVDMILMDAYKKASDYVKFFNEIENDRGNSIMFLGQVGSGKTHLKSCYL